MNNKMKFEDGVFYVVTQKDGYSEDGMITDQDEQSLYMYDGKEGWTVSLDEVESIVERLY